MSRSVFPGVWSKVRRSVPKHIRCPPYAQTGQVPDSRPFIPILDVNEQQRMRSACQLAAEMLSFAGGLVEVGVTTEEIDAQLHEEILRRGAYPSPLNYRGFPKSLCTSINEVVCHGIPDSRPLEDGDILNMDVSVFLDGFHGDTSRMFLVGDVDDEGKRLVNFTKKVLDDSISQLCKPGMKLSEIGNLIHDACDKSGYQSVVDFAGHGVGEDFHALPFIYHFRNNQPGEMIPGMVFTIEPMICEGTMKLIHWDDNWTVATADNKRSAQFEHSILITDDGHEVLTSYE